MIEGLRGKEPVGAVLTIGTKGPSGAPVDKDRFYIKVPDAVSTGSGGDVRSLTRAMHPAFSVYNNEAPELRKSIRGVLVHADASECFEWHRKAQKLPRPFVNHSKLPACTGDGRNAKRLVVVNGATGADVQHLDIPCPNDKCEFAMAPNERTPPCCKPWGRLLFQPVWREGSKLQTPLMKFTTQSWNTLASFVGFFEYFREQARLCGVEHAQLFGLPFELTLGEKTNAEKQSRFPIVRMTPLAQVQNFLLAQGDRVAALQMRKPYVALLDAPEQDPAVVLADKQDIEPGVPMVQG